jgi:hypothetical protein
VRLHRAVTSENVGIAAFVGVALGVVVVVDNADAELELEELRRLWKPRFEKHAALVSWQENHGLQAWQDLVVSALLTGTIQTTESYNEAAPLRDES